MRILALRKAILTVLEAILLAEFSFFLYLP
jgi:hypothetical protein